MNDTASVFVSQLIKVSMTDLTDIDNITKRAVKCAGTVSCKAPSTPEKRDSYDTDRMEISEIFRKKMDMILMLATT